jgi:hypothetical protein
MAHPGHPTGALNPLLKRAAPRARPKGNDPHQSPGPSLFGGPPRFPQGGWGELDADSRELAPLRLWNNGSVRLPVCVFPFAIDPLDKADSHVMLEVVEKRLVGRIGTR